MRHLWNWTIGLALLGAAGPPPESRAQGPGPIELRDGDRIVLVGGTLIEREAESGYLETQLACRYPGRKLVVRNLGWSGDTVNGESHAVGNPVQEGFKQLVEHVVALKPTVIVLGYGANEAFDGAAGLPKFARDLARLWDALAPTGAKFVVLLPPRQANLGPPLPDPTPHNADLKAYGAALRAEAERRGALVLDLYDLIPERRLDADKVLPATANGIRLGDLAPAPPPTQDKPFDEAELGPLTTNGLHLNPTGYWLLSERVNSILAELPRPKPIVAVVDAATGTAPPAPGVNVTEITRTPSGLRFQATLESLPGVPTPMRRDGITYAVFPGTMVRVTGLPPGRYALKVDSQAQPLDGDADAWAKGIPSLCFGQNEQVEALRQKIVAKNLMYFHRWRPQNETYLFGFRKYEQGRNAAELAAFDPLIAAEEAAIAELSRPKPHIYELTRTGEAAPAPRTGEAPR